MLLIYTPTTSTRLSYIAHVLFKHVCKTSFTITTNRNEFATHTGPAINYSAETFNHAVIQVRPHTLLFESNIKLQDVSTFTWSGLKAFFKTGGDIPFDVFASAFYLISRYEEYLPHTKDEYGRYAHTNSLAFKEGFLHLPLVNLWMKELVNILQSKFPSFTIHDSRFTFIPTYDIDIAYAVKGKSTLRNLGGFYKEMFTGKLNQAVERANIHKGFTQDPFDTYAWLDDLHEQYKLKPVYFFLLAEKAKGYDKNLNPHSPEMQNLVRRHAGEYTVGIHPSWQSGDDEEILAKEIGILAAITGKPLERSRQHYIRMALPRTYRLLIQHGIKHEYSMGYGSINGFRASVVSSFNWYDIENETQTDLLVHPYCYMEANSYFEQKYTAEQAGDELQHYHDIVKSVNGQLITLFHNHFVTKQPQWLPWRNMYLVFLQKNF